MTAIAATVAVVLLLQLAVESALAWLNLRHGAAAGGRVPPALEGHVDDATASRSLAYTQAKGRFGILQGVWGAAVTLAALYSGLLPRLDGALAGAGLGEAHRFVAFLALLSAAVSLAHLPLGLWSTFVLEQRFGFNRMTPALWVKDRLKGLALAALLGIPLLYAAWALVAFTGDAWWLWLFALLAAVQLAMVWLYPSLIAPLFNRFEPLPEGPLRARIERLADDAGFRTRGLFVMDASKRSGHSNAYFIGFVRPRIVLFDTLLARLSEDEAISVLAHEIGHFRARHVHKRLALGLGSLLLSLYVLSLLARWPPLFAAFGFTAPTSHAAIALFSLAGGAFTFFLDPLWSWLSRRDEYEADRFAVRLARDPAALHSALVRLSGENLSNLHPHPLYGAWYYSHPALLERLAAIGRVEIP